MAEEVKKDNVPVIPDHTTKAMVLRDIKNHVAIIAGGALTGYLAYEILPKKSNPIVYIVTGISLAYTLAMYIDYRAWNTALKSTL